jgi:hypothetical protein
MVCPCDLRQPSEPGDLAQYLLRVPGVVPNPLPFSLRKSTRLVQGLRGDRQFADVVQQRCPPQGR